MRFRLICIAALALLLTVASCDQSQAPTEPTTPAEPAAQKNPLVGVWSVTERSEGGEGSTFSPAQPGLFIFTDGYYSAVHVVSNEARANSKKSFEPTDEEKVAQYNSIIVNTGTYSVDGDVITYKPMVAKSPEFVGGESKSKFKVEGDVLTIEVQSVTAASGGSPSDVSGSIKLKRLE